MDVDDPDVIRRELLRLSGQDRARRCAPPGAWRGR